MKDFRYSVVHKYYFDFLRPNTVIGSLPSCCLGLQEFLCVKGFLIIPLERFIAS